MLEPDFSLLGIDFKNHYKLCGVMTPKIQKLGSCCEAPMTSIELYKLIVSHENLGVRFNAQPFDFNYSTNLQR